MLTNQELFQLFEKIDRDLAEQVHDEPCPHCGGALHWANYDRSPRGQDKAIRFSLCCSKDGCRRRQTPASVRFLGRKVYRATGVVLLSAMNHGVSPNRIALLRKSLGVSRATLNRWRNWWLQDFVQSTFWKIARAFIMPTLSESALPSALCERFNAGAPAGLLNLLRFLRPVTTLSVGKASGFMMAG